MNPSRILQITEDGDVTTSDAYLREVVLTGGSDAATLVVKAGGSSGTTVLTVKAAANTTATVPLTNVFCDGGIYGDLTGTGPVATFTWV